MNTSTKNLVRTLVYSAILAWPGVEGYRYWQAKQELQSSAQQQETVAVKLASVRSAQVAGQPASFRKK